VTGGPFTYDPFGNAQAGVPDNQIGSFDNGWLGKNQRPLEQQAGLRPVIEMGARAYDPALGRFLSVDPLENGTSNDYAYSGDPVNERDLGGLCTLLVFGDKCKHKTIQRAFWLVAAPVTVVGGAFGVAASCVTAGVVTLGAACGAAAVTYVIGLGGLADQLKTLWNEWNQQLNSTSRVNSGRTPSPKPMSGGGRGRSVQPASPTKAAAAPGSVKRPRVSSLSNGDVFVVLGGGLRLQ
jgi:RHS repeat-associated protein